ncbi:MAG: OsmC family protein [Herbaspirillum sp.]
MHAYTATVRWNRAQEKFIDNRYSRSHEWEFDGGARVAASSSPLTVPLPMSVAANVDPEEALIAATSSCHMLWFLWFAARAEWVVDSYLDSASGVMEKNDVGKLAFKRISLCPKVVFSGPQPTAEQLAQLHHDAHENCFIANSLKAEIVIETN